MMLICCLIWGRVIEDNLFQEIAKWVFMYFPICVIFEVFAYTLSQFFYHGSRWDPTSDKYKALHKSDKNLKYTITENNIHLIDSCEVSKHRFDTELTKIKNLHPNCMVWSRSFRSLKLEWAVHNAAYGLGFQKERTKDCDLNYPQKWYVKIIYAVAGIVVWPFVK